MSVILTLLNMIPGVSSLVQFIVGKWMDSKVAMYQKRWDVAREVAIEAIRSETENNKTKVAWLHEVANSRFLQCLVGGFAFPIIAHMNKAYVWDNIIHKFIWGTYGFTPPMTGYIQEWGAYIVTGIFVTGTGMITAGAIAKRATKE